MASSVLHGAFKSVCDTVHGSQCEVVCDPGYILKRNNTNNITCKYDEANDRATWEGKPECQSE